MRWRLSCHECLSVRVDKEREVLTSQISRTGLFWVSQAKQQFPTHNQLQRLQVLDTESGSYSIHPRAATSAAAIHSRTLQSQVFHRFLLQFLSNTLTFVTKNTFTSLTQHQPCGLTLFSSLFNLIKKKQLGLRLLLKKGVYLRLCSEKKKVQVRHKSFWFLVFVWTLHKTTWISLSDVRGRCHGTCRSLSVWEGHSWWMIVKVFSIFSKSSSYQ